MVARNGEATPASRSGNLAVVLPAPRVESRNGRVSRSGARGKAARTQAGTAYFVGLDELVATHASPFVVIDGDRRIVAYNEALAQFLGTGDESLIGRPCYEVLHGNPVPCYEPGEECPHTQAFDCGGSDPCFHRHLAAEGQRTWVRVRSFRLRTSDGVTLVAEVLEPIAAEAGTRELPAGSLVGASPAFLRCVEQLKLAAASDGAVLLQGETGTGKNLAAEFMHRWSRRKDGPFITLDCTALTESLFESEIFGHERGAFTGSVGRRQGLFELADGGTLFLDEIGELSLEMQAKLMSVLETGQFRRVGGRKTLRASVRVVCASNRPLWDRVQAGRFRADLYYRVACFSVELPALRERAEDIPLLVEALLEAIREKDGRPYTLTPDAIALLRAHTFPGNVRELRNIVQVAAACSDGNRVTADHLALALPMHGRPDALAGEAHGTFAEDVVVRRETGAHHAPMSGRKERASPGGHRRDEQAEPPASATRLRDIEEQTIRSMLAEHGGHRRTVADRLGISERTLYRKLKRYGLE